MGMSNKDKLFLAGLQESMKEFVKADIGKAAKADLKAIEIAAGGKQRLEQSDQILADAEQACVKIRADATGAANGLVSTAKAEIKTARAAFDLEKQQLASRQDNFDKSCDEMESQAEKLDDRAAAIKARENEADNHDAMLTSREMKVNARESLVAIREREVDDRTRRFKEAVA